VWFDFPAGGSGVYSSNAPIRDSEWTRLGFVHEVDVHAAYDRFWPKTGSQQNWDLVGLANFGEDHWSFVLVEAKAHKGEIQLSGTTASQNGGRPMIRNAFVSTLLNMGRTDEDARSGADAWLEGYYQYANRLATLYFLLSAGKPTHLVFLYFCGDAHPKGQFDCPSTPQEWQPTIAKVKTHLGLRGDSDLEKRVHDVFVQVDSIEIGEKT
jgi:hypothetical protein